MSKQLSPVIIGRVEKGKFIPEDKDIFRKAFWTHEKRRVEITIKRHRKKRSVQANNYYWGVVVLMISQAIGEDDAEAVHDMLKLEHNYYIKAVGGREFRVPMSTAELDTSAFEAYLERIRRWASEFLSLYIPLPGEAE